MKVSFDDSVVVTGSPRIGLTIGTQTKHAVYYSGSGTKELVFRYQIVQTDTDSDGLGMTGSIDLNSGSIRDKAGNSLTTLAFSLPSNLSDVLVDGSAKNVVISKTDLSVNEKGGVGTYTVKLNKAPEGTVTVSLSAVGSVATVSPASLTFEANDNNQKLWNRAQTVTVRGVDDSIDNDVGGTKGRSVNVTHSVTSGSDTDYNNMSVIPVSVSSRDDDEIGRVSLTLSPVRVDEKDKSSSSVLANNSVSVSVTAGFTGSRSGGVFKQRRSPVLRFKSFNVSEKEDSPGYRFSVCSGF